MLLGSVPEYIHIYIFLFQQICSQECLESSGAGDRQGSSKILSSLLLLLMICLCNAMHLKNNKDPSTQRPGKAGSVICSAMNLCTAKGRGVTQLHQLHLLLLSSWFALCSCKKRDPSEQALLGISCSSFFFLLSSSSQCTRCSNLSSSTSLLLF